MKLCSPPMVDVMITKMRVGLSEGIVIEKNWRTGPAPSTVAAS